MRWTTLTVVLALVVLGCSGAAEDTDATSAATASSDRAVVSGDGPAPTGAPSQPAPSPTSTSDQPGGAAVGQAAGGDGGGDTAGAPAPREIVAAAVADLAGRLNVRRDDIDVRLAEPVTWPDNSIGCPLRDRQYLDGPIEGARVHLFANRELYRYHAGGERSEPFLCEISLKTEIPIRRLEP
ncbi:hypothetical protein BH23ACT10_BH23ACT10_40000 [soil metagenome]